MTLIK